MIDLKRAITSLSENGVEYVIVGGVAISLHSSGYITQDLDLCFSRSNDNIRRLYRALAPFAPRIRQFPADFPYIFDESTLRNGTNFTFETMVGDMDLLGEVKGLGDYANALANSLTYEIYGTEVKALNLSAHRH